MRHTHTKKKVAWFFKALSTLGQVSVFQIMEWYYRWSHFICIHQPCKNQEGCLYTINQIMAMIKQTCSTKRKKTWNGVGNKYAPFQSTFYCYSGVLWLSLSLAPCVAPSLSCATCIIAFPLQWPRGKWSSPNVTVVILIDGVDTCAVPEHRASPHTDMTNFREQIIMAWLIPSGEMEILWIPINSWRT